MGEKLAHATGYLRGLAKSDAELTRLRDENARLREALVDAIELIERECGSGESDRTLRGVNRINPTKYYDIAAMRQALDTNDGE